MKRFFRFRLVVLTCCIFWVSSIQAVLPVDLITGSSASGSEGADQGTSLSKREVIANLNPQALDLLATGKPVASLRVSLFPDVELELHGVRSSSRLDGTTVNEFSIPGDNNGSAVLSVTDGVLFGTITTGANVVYRIRSEASGIYLVEELDQSRFPECATPPGTGNTPDLDNPPGATAPGPSTDAVVNADDGTLIKVLVAYTQAAETKAGGPGGMASLIATAESETNSGYAVSGVNFVIDVVSTTKVTYDESAGYSTALNAITSTSDGLMDSVHALRDSTHADLVVLIIDNGDYCGIGWLPYTVSSANSAYGFSVVGWNCATGYYSFAHEMGHNMGARHDTYVDAGTTPYPYGHGYANTTAHVRTIMAYNNACGDFGSYCSRVNHWSATDRLYNGTTTIGDASATNNVALNNSAYAIANYRFPPTGSPPDPPVLVEASDGTYNDRVVLSWSEVVEATAYNVYYSSSLESAQMFLGQSAGTQLNIYSTGPGAVWYFWVYSENANGESATGTYDTGYVGQADLAITILDAPEGTFAAGGAMDVVAKIENTGEATSNPYSIAFYASADTNITPEDYGDWYWSLDALEGGASHHFIFQWNLSDPLPNGEYYIGAIVTVSGDSNSANNTRYDPVPVTIASVPGAPTLSSVVPGDGEAALHFAANGNGGSAITGYTATCGGLEQAGASSPITVSGLSNDIQYPCSVIATNVIGDSPASGVLFVTPNPAGAYSIGGIVSGLAGSGLVLQNNGGDDLAVEANGNFTFDTKLDNGIGYAVTIGTQPVNPDQFCVVSNGSGPVSGADVTDVSVACTLLSSCNLVVVSGMTDLGDVTHEACENLVIGLDYTAAAGANITLGSGNEINFLPGFTVEQGATLDVNVCGQSLCATSPSPMPYGCHSCVDQVCDVDPDCCGLAFDQACLDMVDSVCGLSCE